MEKYWWKNAVIYEVYVDKFAQDFKGLTGKLDYLRDLGINCIWLLPHYPSPMVDGGYDVSDYMNVRPALGTLHDFEAFTAKAHSMGIKIIVDFVLNHVSNQHPWFRDKKDYFLWSKTGKEFSGAVNPFSHMKKSNWVFDKERGEYYFATFYPEQADLNWDNSEVFDEMMRVIDFWIDKGVDGFRLDAAPFLIKREGTDCTNLPETHRVIKKIRSHVDSKNPEVILLAEANSQLKQVREYFGNGDECHMAFHFYLMSAFWLAFKRGNKKVIDDVIARSSDIPSNCQWATFLRNHDQLALEHLSQEEKDELLGWLGRDNKFNFEGIGMAMRLATIFNGDNNKILEAFKMLIDAPGSPVIYYGDEIGMKNLELSEKPKDSRKYVRGDFNWQEAEKQLHDKDSLLNRVKEIIKTRSFLRFE